MPSPGECLDAPLGGLLVVEVSMRVKALLATTVLALAVFAMLQSGALNLAPTVEAAGHDGDGRHVGDRLTYSTGEGVLLRNYEAAWLGLREAPGPNGAPLPYVASQVGAGGYYYDANAALAGRKVMTNTMGWGNPGDVVGFVRDNDTTAFDCLLVAAWHDVGPAALAGTRVANSCAAWSNRNDVWTRSADGLSLRADAGLAVHFDGVTSYPTRLETRFANYERTTYTPGDGEALGALVERAARPETGRPTLAPAPGGVPDDGQGAAGLPFPLADALGALAAPTAPLGWQAWRAGHPDAALVDAGYSRLPVTERGAADACVYRWAFTWSDAQGEGRETQVTRTQNCDRADLAGVVQYHIEAADANDTVPLQRLWLPDIVAASLRAADGLGFDGAALQAIGYHADGLAFTYLVGPDDLDGDMLAVNFWPDGALRDVVRAYRLM